jgi:hypothetical protein
MLPRIIRINQENKELEEANEFFFLKFDKNKKKLDEGLLKGQHHMQIRDFNTQ